MCMSPHELSSARIEQDIVEMREFITAEEHSGDQWASARQIWTGRIEKFERLLKERADNGTY